MADAPFGIGHTAFLFAPASGGQQQVGVAAGFGGAEGFLHDDKGAQAKRLVDQLLVRHGLSRVGAGDPQSLDAAVAHRLEQLDSAKPRLVWQLGNAPIVCNLAAVLGIARVTVAGQQVGQAAGLTAAHGVGLTGQREGAGADFADLAGGQVQVDQGVVLGAAGAGLVQPHAPQREKAVGLADQLGCLAQVCLADIAECRDAHWRVVLHECLQCLKAVGMGVDEVMVDVAVVQ